MRTTITTKGFKFIEEEKAKLDIHLEKLRLALSKFKEDLPLLSFILRKDKKVGSPEKTVSPYYYEGTLRLELPKKPLIAHVNRLTPHDAIDEAFQRIMKEVQTYKGKHFKSHSKYKSHTSLKSLAPVLE